MADMPLVYEVEPQRKNTVEPDPVIVLLHGRGADERDLLSLVPPAVPDFFIVSVRAPYRFPYGGYTWFDLENIGDPNLDQIEESAGLLSKFLVEIQTLHRIDPDNIFLFGFSMGAMMALEIALRTPAKIKGIVAHSGCVLRAALLPHQSEQLRSLSIFVAHGTYDPVIPVWIARESSEFLRQAHVPVHYREYPIEHTISDESLRDASLWLRDQLTPQGVDG
jgi:phospholipase/carboxylesterase